MTKEAMKLALDALEASLEFTNACANGKIRHGWGNQLDDAEAAITALREALAAPAPPPWWPAVENILQEYGLQAIDFVADFKAAQQSVQQELVAPADEMLTHDEWDELQDQCEEMVSHNFRFAVLAKLREKLAAQREDWGPGPHEIHSLPAQPKPRKATTRVSCGTTNPRARTAP